MSRRRVARSSYYCTPHSVGCVLVMTRDIDPERPSSEVQKAEACGSFGQDDASGSARSEEAAGAVTSKPVAQPQRIQIGRKEVRERVSPPLRNAYHTLARSSGFKN